MTVEDAIKQLRDIQAEALEHAMCDHRDGEYDTIWDRDVEALDMAIAALDELLERQTSSGSVD